MSHLERSAHVVIVERDRWVAKAFERSLQLVGLNVVSFADEVEARGYLMHGNPLAVVCEFYEGEADGVSTLLLAKEAAPNAARRCPLMRTWARRPLPARGTRALLLRAKALDAG
jgi:DNA-binding NarL/FixJ family response regulator